MCNPFAPLRLFPRLAWVCPGVRPGFRGKVMNGTQRWSEKGISVSGWVEPWVPRELWALEWLRRWNKQQGGYRGFFFPTQLKCSLRNNKDDWWYLANNHLSYRPRTHLDLKRLFENELLQCNRCAIRKTEIWKVWWRTWLPGKPWAEKKWVQIKPLSVTWSRFCIYLIVGILTGFPSKPRGPCWRTDGEDITKRRKRATFSD